MKNSEPIYVAHDHKDFMAIVWETELGQIVTVEGKLDIRNDLNIVRVCDNEKIDNIDLRNVLISILPRK